MAGEGTTLLRMWEVGKGLPPSARGAALLHAAGEDAPPGESLGRRAARLLRLHARLFGPVLEAVADCPHCGALAGFGCEAAALCPPPAEEAVILAAGLRLRPPAAEDLASLPPGLAAEAARTWLLHRLVMEGEPPPAPDWAAVAAAIERADPGAVPRIALRCPECKAEWVAGFDACAFLWEEVRSAAALLMQQVARLARAFGWTEGEVLSLGPHRRAAYLALAEGAP